MTLDPIPFPIELTKLFQEVIKINEMVGNVALPNRDRLQHQLDIIQSEFGEFLDGLEAGDTVETRDGCADTLFTLAGLYGRMQFELPTYLPSAQVDLDDLESHKSAHDFMMVSMGAILVLSRCSFASVYIAIKEVTEHLIANLLYVADSYMIDYVEDLRAVIDSNWTKFDTDEGSAMATRLKYEALGIAVEQRHKEQDGKTFTVTFSAADQKDEKGRDMRKGKWLKSVNFVDVNFGS